MERISNRNMTVKVPHLLGPPSALRRVCLQRDGFKFLGCGRLRSNFPIHIRRLGLYAVRLSEALHLKRANNFARVSLLLLSTTRGIGRVS